jgi:hypothetical protein
VDERRLVRDEGAVTLHAPIQRLRQEAPGRPLEHDLGIEQ